MSKPTLDQSSEEFYKKYLGLSLGAVEIIRSFFEMTGDTIDPKIYHDDILKPKNKPN